MYPINLTEELKKEYKYFLERKQLFQDYDDLYDKIVYLENKNSPGISWAVFFYIFTAFSILLWIIVYNIYKLNGGSGYFIWIVAITLQIILSGLTGTLILLKSLDNKNKRDEAVQKIIKERIIIEGELEEYYEDYNNCLVPISFSNPMVIKMLIRQSKEKEYKILDDVLDDFLNERGISYDEIHEELSEQALNNTEALFISSDFFY